MRIEYISQNLRYDYERFGFEDKNTDEVADYLNKVRRGIETLSKWAEDNTPQVLAEQIKNNGRSDWIENLWLKKYAEVLSDH